MLQTKDWLNGYKNKTHIYAIYIRLTSEPEPNTNWKWDNEKRYFMQTEMTRVTILIWEKTDFKTKDIQKDKGGYCIMIKGPLQRDANKHEGRNWQEYNN